MRTLENLFFLLFGSTAVGKIRQTSGIGSGTGGMWRFGVPLWFPSAVATSQDFSASKTLHGVKCRVRLWKDELWNSIR